MNVTYCDICETPIKPSDIKWVFGIIEREEEGEDVTVLTVEELSERLRIQQQRNKKVKTYEICTGCKKVLDSFLALRRSQVLKIKNEIDKIDI